MTRWLAGILAGVLLVGGLYAWGRQGHQNAAQAVERTRVVQTQLNVSNAALKTANEDAERNRTIAASRLKDLTVLRKDYIAKNKELQNALQANRQWADAPVPDGVWDALTGPRSGASAAQPPKP
jgi:hypothetical protein